MSLKQALCSLSFNDQTLLLIAFTVASVKLLCLENSSLYPLVQGIKVLEVETQNGYFFVLYQTISTHEFQQLINSKGMGEWKTILK